MAGSPLSNASATSAFESFLSTQLVVLPGESLGQPRRDGVRLALKFRDDRVAIAQRVEEEARFLLGGVAHAGADRRRQQPVPVGVEQSIVVFGDDLVAAEDDHAAPLLQEIVEGGHLRLTELSDVAEDHHVVGGQLAMG